MPEELQLCIQNQHRAGRGMFNFLVSRRCSSSGLLPMGTGCKGMGWASVPGEGRGPPLPLLCPCRCPAVPAHLAHGIHPRQRAGHTGLCPTLLSDCEQDRNSEVPFLQADRLRLCVTKSHQLLCLHAGATALPWALWSAGQSTPSGPATTVSLQLRLLTCWPHSLVLGSVLHPSPPGACLQCRMSPGTRKVPLKRGWVRRSLCPLAPPLTPYSLPRKGQALQSSTRPSQPTLSGSVSQCSPRPFPEKPPFRRRRGPGTSGPALHFITFTFVGTSLLPECTATLSTLDPAHTSGPSTEGPSAEPPESPATSAHPGTSPRLCYTLQGAFTPHGKSSWLTYSVGFCAFALQSSAGRGLCLLDSKSF